MNRQFFYRLLVQAMLIAGVTVGVVRRSLAISFNSPLVIPTQDQPSGIAIADIDGDGKSDMVALNYGTQAAAKVEVYRNTSLTTILAFDAPKLLDSEPHPIALAISDLDGDGKPDIIVGHFSSYQDGVNSGRISIYRNTSSPGALSFSSPVVLSCNYGVKSVCVADLDNDGRPEIVAASANGMITIFRNTSSVAHLNQTSFSSTLGLKAVDASGVLAADLDGDGRIDLIAYGTGNLTLFQNTLDRIGDPISFSRAKDVSLNLFQIFAVVAADLDGDSKLDLAVVENSAALLSVFLNNSTPGALEARSFSTKISQPFPGVPRPFPWAMAAGDYAGDGRTDLACGVNESVILYQNTGNSPFTTNSLIPSVQLHDSDWRGFQIASGDIDGDGLPDLAVANLDDKNISIFINSSPVATNRPSIAVLRRADSTLTLRITSKPGYRFTLWSSSDLITWNQFLSLANSQGVLELDSIRPAPLPVNFFKVQQSP